MTIQSKEQSVHIGLAAQIPHKEHPVVSSNNTMADDNAEPNSKSAVLVQDIDTHTQNLRQVDAAVTGIAEAAPSLHPAAAVFRDEILGNVGARIKALEKNNARIRHLANLIQDVELAFHTKSTRRGQGEHEDNDTIYVRHHETFMIKHQLSRGSIEAYDGEERLVLPIDDAPAQPVEDCGSIGFVSLRLARTTLGSIGSFPPTNSNISDPAQVLVEEDGSVLLRLHLSKQIVIAGKLHSSLLSNEALIKCTEEPNFMTFLTTPLAGMGIMNVEGAGENRKCIVFTPLVISFEVTSWLKKTLALVDQMSSPHGSKSVDVKLESDDGLRRLVVEALGDSEHKELFSDYVALKHENNILSELRNMMLGVTVRHSRGSFTVNLDKGERLGDFWRVGLDAGDRSAITVAEFSRMEVSVCGMRLRLTNGWELADLSSLIDHEGNTALWFMKFQASDYLKFDMVVRFNWAELDEDEIREILQDFSPKMMKALGFRVLNNDAPNADTDAFPPTFQANVVGFFWETPMAIYRLKSSGLWDEDLLARFYPRL